MEPLEHTVRRRVEPRSNPDPVAPYCGLAAAFLIEDPESLGDQPGAAVTLAIALVEPLVGDRPRLVEHEGARIGQVHVAGRRRDAVDGVVLLNALVDEAESPHDETAFVRQERVANSVRLGEGRQDRDRVVADRKECDAIRGQRGKHLLQLDQLRFAVGSPLGAPVENDDGLATGSRGVEVDRAPGLIRQHDIGKALAFVRPDLAEVSR